MTPINPLYVQQISHISLPTSAEATYPRLPWQEIVILPYQIASHFGGYVSSICLKPSQSVSFNYLRDLASKIISSLDLDLYFGWNGEVWQSSKVTKYQTFGWEATSCLIFIGALSITNAILASVKERRGEIYVLNTLGLSPSGVLLVFITETVVYAFISVLFGYFLGFILNTISVNLGILPHHFIFNFVSTSMIIALGAIVMACVAAAIYPAFMAFKIAAPQIERKWKIPTKPKGDEWEVPLMVRIGSGAEVLAFLKFLREYYLGAGSAGRGFIIDEVEALQPDKMELGLKIRLAPFEAQILQYVKIIGFEIGGVYNLSVYIKRISGTKEIWISSNSLYLDALRKQVLVWRSLTPMQQKQYIEKEKHS
jgi:hypothetical protein